MTDQPNLKQFLDEMGSFSDEDGAAARRQACRKSALPPIGHVVEIAGSGSQVRLDPAALEALASHSDPSVAMSGQVGSQVKMIVGSSLLIANVRTMRADDASEIIAHVDFLGEGDRDSSGRLSNFRRGVTKFPIPGCKVHPVTSDDLRAVFAADDRAHIEIGTVYPTDDIRGALYIDADAVEAFRGPRQHRYRQIDLGRADPPPHFGAFARGSHRDDRPARRIFRRVQGLRRAVQRRQSAAALLADELRRALRGAADDAGRRARARRATSSPSCCSPRAPRARTSRRSAR